MSTNHWLILRSFLPSKQLLYPKKAQSLCLINPQYTNIFLWCVCIFESQVCPGQRRNREKDRGTYIRSKIFSQVYVLIYYVYVIKCFHFWLLTIRFLWFGWAGERWCWSTLLQWKEEAERAIQNWWVTKSLNNLTKIIKLLNFWLDQSKERHGYSEYQCGPEEIQSDSGSTTMAARNFFWFLGYVSLAQPATLQGK